MLLTHLVKIVVNIYAEIWVGNRTLVNCNSNKNSCSKAAGGEGEADALELLTVDFGLDMEAF